jgi:hypothetical protein
MNLSIRIFILTYEVIYLPNNTAPVNYVAPMLRASLDLALSCLDADSIITRS